MGSEFDRFEELEIRNFLLGSVLKESGTKKRIRNTASKVMSNL